MTSSLHVWHLTSDAPRLPRRVSPGERVRICVGTWPAAPGQSVWLTWRVGNVDRPGRVPAIWQHNGDSNSYWCAEIGPFSREETVEYTVHARDQGSEVTGPTCSFRVGPKIHLAILWHQHQPLYGVPSVGATDRVCSKLPWVRLHALRDYYSMPALVAEHPDVHVTFNLTPVLLAQIDDYVERGATDRQLELTLEPAERLSPAETEELLTGFFDADWHRQIFVHPRYRELFDKRVHGQPFSTQDLRDLQMWFNLAWFGSEFRRAPVELMTGERVDVHRFVEQAEGFTPSDVQAMVAEQYKVLRAVVPIHRLLQERRQIEVTTTPFFHPILPLLIDTNHATIDLPGAVLPPRFAHPEDADQHVRRAVEDYERRFECLPRGMWPAEGAVSPASVPIFARHGIEWIASDRGVLARSGRWGYNADDPDVSCRPYVVREHGEQVAIFFRDTSLSDDIGFRYQHVHDAALAASQFVHDIEHRIIGSLEHDEDRIVTVILDGENAWGAYPDDGRPFLRAVYGELARSSTIQTVTFSEYLRGNPHRALEGHPPDVEVHHLFTGSWIDEVRSHPGVDLGTWIGEPAENRAWELLGVARKVVEASSHPGRARALAAIYAAEGSDWFWWFGDDQDSGRDELFDDLFREHLLHAYREIDLPPPHDLTIPLVSRRVVWSFANPLPTVVPGDWLTIRTNCPGLLVWQFDDRPPNSQTMQPVGGVMAGARRFQLLIGRVEMDVQRITFRFHCETHNGEPHDACCHPDTQVIEIRGHLANADGRTDADRGKGMHGQNERA